MTLWHYSLMSNGCLFVYQIDVQKTKFTIHLSYTIILFKFVSVFVELELVLINLMLCGEECLKLNPNQVSFMESDDLMCTPLGLLGSSSG